MDAAQIVPIHIASDEIDVPSAGRPFIPLFLCSFVPAISILYNKQKVWKTQLGKFHAIECIDFLNSLLYSTYIFPSTQTDFNLKDMANRAGAKTYVNRVRN